MRGNRWSPGRLNGVLCLSQRLRERTPVAVIANGFMWGANRPVGPTRLVGASLIYSGDLDAGTSQGDTRTLEGLTVTNNGTVAVGVEIESDETQESFSATVQPGATLNLAGLSLNQSWNEDRPTRAWDGLSIRFREPA